MIKCVVFDLDGTLFYNFGSDVYDLSYEARKAIELITKNNIQFAISSGRQYPVARKVMEKYVHKYGPSCNMTGSIVFDNDNIVRKYFLNRKEIDFVYNLIKDTNFGYIEFFKEDGVCLSVIKDYDFYNSNKDHGSDVSLFGFEENIDRFNEIGKIMLCYKTSEECKKNYEIIKEKLKNIVHHTISTGRYIEITKIGTGKKNIVEYLNSEYKYNKDEIAIVGDSENDMEMLNIVKYSYIMSHADDSLKKQCYRIVDNVLEVVEDVININKNMQ